MAEDETATTDDLQRDDFDRDDFDRDEPTQDFVPDMLAHALIVPDPGVVEEPTPTSVVDEWAFSDDEHRFDDDEDLHERISSMPGLGDDAEGPSMTTLRPSAVTLRPKQIERRSREPWLLAAVAMLAIGGGVWLTAGGPRASSTWCINPQYWLTVSKDTTVTIELSVPDPRLPAERHASSEHAQAAAALC